MNIPVVMDEDLEPGQWVLFVPPKVVATARLDSEWHKETGDLIVHVTLRCRIIESLHEVLGRRHQ